MGSWGLQPPTPALQGPLRPCPPKHLHHILVMLVQREMQGRLPLDVLRRHVCLRILTTPP